MSEVMLLKEVGTVWDMLRKTYEYWSTRKDQRVLNILKESRRDMLVKLRPGLHVVCTPRPVVEIARKANREPESVYCSLRRLEDRGEVHEVRDGWNLGRRPQPITPDGVACSRWKL